MKSPRSVADSDSRGSVLLLALWALFFLAALAVAVGTRVSAGLDLARRIQNDTTACCLARAGIEKAIMDVAADTNVWDGLDQPWYNSEKRFHNIPLGGGGFSVSYDMETQPGQRETFYGVTGEEGKININRAGRGLLKALLEMAGNADTITATELATAICDWRTPDDKLSPLTGEVGNGYYESLDPPYRCHNAEFESRYELLLVKGMGKELFSKIEPYVTIFGTGKINVNTADATVLASAAYSCGGQAGVCESLVAKLMVFRRGGNVFHVPDAALMTRQLNDVTPLGINEKNLLTAMMGTLTIRSTCFGGTATGRVTGGKAEQDRIEFVFDRERMTKLYWYER